jgi:hypothetical protein
MSYGAMEKTSWEYEVHGGMAVAQCLDAIHELHHVGHHPESDGWLSRGGIPARRMSRKDYAGAPNLNKGNRHLTVAERTRTQPARQRVTNSILTRISCRASETVSSVGSSRGA